MRVSGIFPLFYLQKDEGGFFKIIIDNLVIQKRMFYETVKIGIVDATLFILIEAYSLFLV